MGQFLTHLGPQKPKKLSHRFSRILITGSKAVWLGDVEATAKQRMSPGEAFTQWNERLMAVRRLSLVWSGLDKVLPQPIPAKRRDSYRHHSKVSMRAPMLGSRYKNPQEQVGANANQR